MIDHSSLSFPESTNQLALLNVSIQEERASGKKLRGQVQQLEEELGEVKGEKEGLEKVGGAA